MTRQRRMRMKEMMKVIDTMSGSSSVGSKVRGFDFHPSVYSNVLLEIVDYLKYP